MPNDDDDTPVETPRHRRSSVTVTTAELVLEQLAARRGLPTLSPATMDDDTRDDCVAIILDHCRAAVARFLAAERRESERLRAELEFKDQQLTATQRELAAMRRMNPGG